jgi:hypothetical protein
VVRISNIRPFLSIVKGLINTREVQLRHASGLGKKVAGAKRTKSIFRGRKGQGKQSALKRSKFEVQTRPVRICGNNIVLIRIEDS